MFSKIKKTGSSTMNESLRLKMKKHKNYGLCLTDDYLFLSPQTNEIEKPQNSQNSPNSPPFISVTT